MKRLLLPLLLALSTVGCAMGDLMGSAHEPASPELARLDMLAGKWVGEAEFVSPTPEEMQKVMREQMPDYEGEMPTVFKGGHKAKWALDGHFLEIHGWHEEEPGVKVHYKELYTWDANEKKYRTYYFGSKGDSGSGWLTWDAATKTFHMTAQGTSEGQPMTGSGTMTFIDAETMEWTWQGDGPMGTMKMKGTSRRM